MDLAGRLALEIGIDDPEQWLELAPERVIAFWAAFDRRHPIGTHTIKHAEVLSTLETILAAIVNPNLKEHERIKPRSAKDFLPAALADKPKRKASLAQQLQVIAKVYGGKWQPQSTPTQ